MEGEVTMIYVDTSIISSCWFSDQIHAVQIYCERKLKAHSDNLVGIIASGQLDTGSCLAPTNLLEEVTSRLRALKPLKQEYTDLFQGMKLFCLGWFGQADMKKRIVVFSGGPLLSTTGQLPEPIPLCLKEGRVVLDVIDFGPRFKGKEDSKAKYLKAVVDTMNENNENEDNHYFLIEDDGFSLSHHILSSSILPPLVAKEEAPVSRTSMLSMEGELTMICVDTSITSLCWFHDQIRAVEIYCTHKLKARPDNLVSIARFGQRDIGTSLYPTNCLEKVTSRLCDLKPLKQEYTDLFQGFKLFCLGWFGQADMKKRIVVFSGSPLLSTTGQPPEAIALLLKKGRVVLDVIDFGTRDEDKEDFKAKYLMALVNAMNDNNENGDNHYFLIEDDGFSLSHHISSSIIPLPLVTEEKTPTILIRGIRGGWSFIYFNHDIAEEVVDEDVEEVDDSGWFPIDFNEYMVEEVVDSGVDE